MKKIKTIVAIIIMMAVLTACGMSVPIDFADAESFEAALNAGENLEGKVVQFTAGEFHPDSAFGYDVWAGEHLNFISSSHPDIAQGDMVVVKAKKIENVLGSWMITYDKVKNGKISKNTRSTSATAQTQNTEDNNTPVAANNTATVNNSKSTQNSAVVVNGASATNETESSNNTIKAEPTIEAVDADIYAFQGYLGPQVSAYVAFRNTSDYPIKIQEACFNYEDNDGKLLATDMMINCIPAAIKPGQIGYMYSYYHDISGVDLSNGLSFEPDGKIVEANNFYEIDVSDVSANTSSFMDVTVIGRGTNNTGSDQSLATPGAVFFDKDGKVMGFCYGIESFDNGQTKSFQISGDLMTEDFKSEDLDHVEVYIQGASWY